MLNRLTFVIVGLIIVDIVSLYLFIKSNNKIKLEDISEDFLNKKISLEKTENILKRKIDRVKKISYINVLTTSLNICFIATTPILFCYRFATGPSMILHAFVVALIIFIIIPGFFLKQHEKVTNSLNEMFNEFMSVLKSSESDN